MKRGSWLLGRWGGLMLVKEALDGQGVSSGT